MHITYHISFLSTDYNAPFAPVLLLLNSFSALCPFFSPFLNDHSYTPSQADVTVFKSLSGSKPDAQYPHAARWYSHIESYSSQHSSLPGDSSKSAEALVPKAASGSGSAPKAAAPAAAEEDDDEVDLFGSDEEDDAEAEKLKAERVAAYQEKKAGKPKAAAKVCSIFSALSWCLA